jgi:hypothetical protein
MPQVESVDSGFDLLDGSVSATQEKVSKSKYSRTKTQEVELEVAEVTLSPVSEIPSNTPVDHLNNLKTTEMPSSIPAPTVTDLVIREIRDNPVRAREFVSVLGTITMDWEAIGTNGSPINEVPVPPGKNPKDFIRSANGISHISGFKLSTIFGKEVAFISKDSPKWRVTVLGEYQVDSPIIQSGATAEATVKKFAEEKVKSKGYILGF